MRDELRVWPNEVKDATSTIDAATYVLRDWFNAARIVGLDVSVPMEEIQRIWDCTDLVDRIAGEWSAEQFKETQQDVANTVLASLSVAEALSEKQR